MWSNSRLISLAAALLLSSPASAERVCVEEAAGVCLKYREVAPAKPAAPEPATPRAPAAPSFPNSAEAQEENGLNLSRNEYRKVQAGLRNAGYYSGPLDGVMGGGSRKALTAWQAANGAAKTGFLTFEQALALQENRPLAASFAPAPQATASETASPSETELPAMGKEYVARFANRDPVFGGDIVVVAKRKSDTIVELSVSLEGATLAGYNFSDECETPPSGQFSCQIRTRADGTWQVSGAYPDIVVNGKAISLW